MVFSDLPDIKKVLPRNPGDDALFAELAQVLEKHNALDRFGITLLHTHFETYPGEVLLETTDRVEREQRIVPVQLGDIAGMDITETAWRLGPRGEAILDCVCIQVQGSHTGRHHHNQ